MVDAANVLPPATEAALTAKLEALQRDTHRQLVVATIPDLQGFPQEEYGYRLGRSWGVGLRDVNNGAVFFIAPNEPAGRRGLRIEVGTGLEPILTDAFSHQVIEEVVKPKLVAGDIAGGMEAGTDALIAQLRAAPDDAKARTDAAATAFDRAHRGTNASGGGGLPLGLIFWGIVLLVVVLPALRGGRGQRRWRGGGGGSAWPIVLWSLGNELGRGGGSGGGIGGGWGGGSSGGDSGGSSWGGGGFSGGGGGSFGGGGASGSW